MWACGVSIIDDSLQVTTTPGVARKFLKRCRIQIRGTLSVTGRTQLRRKAKEAFRELFETDCETFFVFSGTAANSLAIGSFCSAHHSVLCHRHSHVESDECNAPGFLNQGLRIVTVDGENGKIDLPESPGSDYEVDAISMLPSREWSV